MKCTSYFPYTFNFSDKYGVRRTEILQTYITILSKDVNTSYVIDKSDKRKSSVTILGSSSNYVKINNLSIFNSNSINVETA